MFPASRHALPLAICQCLQQSRFPSHAAPRAGKHKHTVCETSRRSNIVGSQRACTPLPQTCFVSNLERLGYLTIAKPRTLCQIPRLRRTGGSKSYTSLATPFSCLAHQHQIQLCLVDGICANREVGRINKILLPHTLSRLFWIFYISRHLRQPLNHCHMIH